MNLTKLKTFAPAARNAFIEAVTRRAGALGIQPGRVEAVTESGDVALIGGQPFPRSIVPLRKQLLEIIQRDGFGPTMESMAYTWFNRLVALRFMELHDGYLDHGYRVLSHPEGSSLPEILQHAEHVTLTGLDRDEVIRLKLDGNRDEELYRMLLLAQCHELGRILPSIFSRLDDATILLLPDNLLHSDSVVRQLVGGSEEGDWQEVEVLGWLYQFYISEKKDKVMARKSAVPTEDIPAVTQLFTPHWIVRYLVENSLGRLWLLNRPGSRLREHMPYYIEGEPETDFLKISKPEDIRLIDPAVGSGHMLTYAFDLLVLIYEEEGYAASDIPGLILRHNLHGMDLCPRAAQLAELALVFKAREKSRRFFQPEHLVRPRIIELRDVRFAENELPDYIQALGLGDLFNQPMLRLLHQFEEAKNFGSLIQPCLDERAIAFARRAIEAKDLGGQLFLRETHLKVLRVLEQAEALTQRYHVVVANPPYMGSGAMNPAIKGFVLEQFPEGKADLYGAFILRNLKLLVQGGFVGMITIPNWLFLEAFTPLRNVILDSSYLSSLVHNGRGVWGGDFGSVAFTIVKAANSNRKGVFKRLFKKQGEIQSNSELEANFINVRDYPTHFACSSDFAIVPGRIIAYWTSPQMRSAFANSESMGSRIPIKTGMSTTDNVRFLRRWYEVEHDNTKFDAENHEDAARSGKKWFPYKKGGDFRKWYGNDEYVLNWRNDGEEIKSAVVNNPSDPKTKHWSRRIFGTEYFFLPSICWSRISISYFSVRVSDSGTIFSDASNGAFPNQDIPFYAAFLNSGLATAYLHVLSPTINFYSGDIARLPLLKKYPEGTSQRASTVAGECIGIARADWDNFETSWDFRDQPLLRPGLKGATLEASWRNWEAQSTAAIRRMQELETENNRLFIAAYGLEGELQPEVPEEQISLFCNPASRYKKKAKRKKVAEDEATEDSEAQEEVVSAYSPEERSKFFRADTIREFLSYAVGCMMGRYSPDHPGLILANAGESAADYRLKLTAAGLRINELTFLPDEDGILPVLDGEWFEDDIVFRIREFLRATFGEGTEAENVRFIEAALGRDLRDYFLSDFYKDHLQTYKNRPIYWLFSSGKQKAFQCLVYLHRYTPGTLARMRTEYVIPLQGKLAARIPRLEEEIGKATTSASRKKLQTDLDKTKKQIVELVAYDEQLRSYSDQAIALDLDDGVKVNYAKFGPLLAEAKKVCGTKDD